MSGDAVDTSENQTGCANGCNAPFGVRCSVCNTEKLSPIKVLCEGSNLVGHAWFAETIGECVLCQMCGGTFEAVVGHPDQVPLHDRIDIIAMITRGDFDNDIANAHRECCCTVEDGKAYCGDPECDIYYCQDCGPEFDEPCTRHEGVAHS